MNLDEIRARQEKADKTVVDLCQGEIKWRMSIPARPDSDPDIVIMDSLCDIPKLIAEIERLNEGPDLWREWFNKDSDPIYASEMGGDLHCFFCGEFQVSNDDNRHKEDCIYVRAKRLIEERAAVITTTAAGTETK